MREVGGVARVIKEVKETLKAYVIKYLTHRRFAGDVEEFVRIYQGKRKSGGYCDLSESEIETQSKVISQAVAGMVSAEIETEAGHISQAVGPMVANALGVAFQLGVDRAVAAEQLEEDTKPLRVKKP